MHNARDHKHCLVLLSSQLAYYYHFTTDANSLMNQSKFEADSCGPGQARESAHVQVTVGRGKVERILPTSPKEN